MSILKAADPRKPLAKILVDDAEKDPVVNGSRERMAKLVDDAASQMSRLFTGHINEFSAERIISYLLRRSFDVEIRVKKAPRNRRGKLTVKAVR